jgi:hypothetical protein
MKYLPMVAARGAVLVWTFRPLAPCLQWSSLHCRLRLLSWLPRRLLKRRLQCFLRLRWLSHTSRLPRLPRLRHRQWSSSLRAQWTRALKFRTKLLTHLRRLRR